jgi:2-keto-4-pentenoate hydratase/2-oxohepta-3-ene-1,7-dioic acid hydratase in catechol pathway
MRLLRFGTPGEERPGVLDAEGSLRDLSRVVSDYDPAFFADSGWQARVAAAARAAPVVEGRPRIGPPVAGTSKIVGLGMNFREGVRRAGMEMPKEPLLFIKSATSIAGPDDDLALPDDAGKLDWEVELAVVIGRPCYRADEAQAEAAIAGYTILNDLSERRWQNEQGGEWCKGKSADGFAPLGPWLVTPDEAGDPGALDLWLDLNGQRMQGSNTSDMIVGVRQAVAYASRFIRLLPCDVIAMGTPPGTGWRLTPPRFLRRGDVMRLGVAGLGEQVTRIV